MGRLISLDQRREDAHVEHLAFAHLVEERMSLLAQRYVTDFAADTPSLVTIALIKDTREQAKRTAREQFDLGPEPAA